MPVRLSILTAVLLSWCGGKVSELEGTALVSSSSDVSEVATFSKFRNIFARHRSVAPKLWGSQSLNVPSH